MEHYNKEEKELIEWYESESDNFISVGDQELDRLREIFRSNLKRKSEPYTEVSFTVNSNDFALFKDKAEKMGVPYKSLLAFFVNKYATTTKNERSSD